MVAAFGRGHGNDRVCGVVDLVAGRRGARACCRRRIVGKPVRRHLDGKPIKPTDRKSRFQELARDRLEPPAPNHVIAHLLAGLLPARHAGVRGHQANGLHFLGELAVVIATPGRLAKSLLPLMHELVHDRPQYLWQEVAMITHRTMRNGAS